ncbi:hypothetical protein Cgig2_010743 [Carnegiea gigantea]|uniref:Uncharacterized protein n=1 Tax=Carnegiea gigantea TaxID=171969 RepID=A0A9Q1KKQ1_9CARY|nr:hypothetical protein Cgig2_010743 [Carnegiea gigantea]
MVEGTTYDGNVFINAVKGGLKLLNPSAAVEQSSSSSYQSVFPTAPLIYAEVAGHISGGGVPTLVPLQLTRVSVKVLAEANMDPLPSSISVRFKASWFVEDQYTDYPVILAVPVGHQGALVRYEMRVYGIGPATLHKDELANCRPHSNNLYLVSLPPSLHSDTLSFKSLKVKASYKGGTLADVAVSYIQDFATIDEERERYSFSVPLSIPTYVTSRRKERFQNEKIRVILACRGPRSIEDCVITSHPMIGIITGEKKQVFLQESDGYSNKDLECSFRVTSSAIGQPKLCHQECLFIKAIEEGLKLICCPKGTSSALHSLLPTAPVLYAVVCNMDLLDIEAASAGSSFHLPALVPLQMTWLSVKVDAEPKPDSVHVRFKGKWSVKCIKKGSSGALVLAVPVGHRRCAAPGFVALNQVDALISLGRDKVTKNNSNDMQVKKSKLMVVLMRCKGCILQYEIQVSYHGQEVETEEFTASSGPQFQNLYFVPLPLVEGGADVCIQCHYTQDLFQKDRVFSFRVPLSVPSYVSQIPGKSSRKGRIKLTLECKDAETITECDIPSHDMKVAIICFSTFYNFHCKVWYEQLIITTNHCDTQIHKCQELILDERMRVFQQELLSYSNKDLACSFRVGEGVPLIIHATVFSNLIFCGEISLFADSGIDHLISRVYFIYFKRVMQEFFPKAFNE